MLDTANPTKKSIHDWTRAYGDWLSAGSDVWKQAQARMNRDAKPPREVLAALRRLDVAHERLKRALAAL